ncbi:Methyl-accepting chemotaxis sensory transducer [Desulfamplus magnetovallimortis]|uniref:Methyl-accepting chemotaxis sensory transducer n=1 Tax=Desulfamplus magnetovallimortis TaxID=1246637 RepID=A0A1W1HHS2_9BACT|nr:methyl-accepting chemotaxis protein [Desulfamplus magnetovallimortis]SLM32047.1 Methyl-accepting chemotaxis sensory transducer [Desulfamplus magnetovallimortis]
MSQTRFFEKIMVLLFPNPESRISGGVYSLLLLNFFSFICLSGSFFYPEYAKNFLIAGFLLSLFSLFWAFAAVSTLKKMIHGTFSGIESMFAVSDDGRINISEPSVNFETEAALKIGKSYSAFIKRLAVTVEKIRGIGIETAFGTTSIAKRAAAVSKNAGTQKELSESVAAASREADSALKEVSESTQYVAEKTTRDLDLAQSSYRELMDVTEKVKQINESVESFRVTVDELGRSSSSILKIVDTINEIADMTALLSLNATIEAARAGEHGKGFAVVAEEVRELSKKIKPATDAISKNVSEMIEIVKQTQSGTLEISGYSELTGEVVGKTVDNFKDMVADFEKANDELVKIASAIEELSTNNSEVTSMVENINSITREIAIEVSETEKSIYSLNSVTEKMLEMVSGVKTGTGKFDMFISFCHNTREIFTKKMVELKDSGVNLFDTGYKKVPGTNPQKYLTSFTEPFARKMQEILDEKLKEIEGGLYCLLIDRNGYLPLHHSQFSKPMTGDPEKDLLNSRHQRIFLSNTTEKRRCTHTETMLLQTYMRDTGQILNDFSMPIYIDGRHWGAMIIGFDARVMLN